MWRGSSSSCPGSSSAPSRMRRRSWPGSSVIAARSFPSSTSACSWTLPLVRIGSAPASSWSTPRPAIPIDAIRTGHDSAEDGGSTPTDRTQTWISLGLIAERVSDLITVRPEQVSPPAVQLPQAPYLGAIVQTDEGMVQLIAVEKLREAALEGAADRPGIRVQGLRSR